MVRPPGLVQLQPLLNLTGQVHLPGGFCRGQRLLGGRNRFGKSPGFSISRRQHVRRLGPLIARNLAKPLSQTRLGTPPLLASAVRVSRFAVRTFTNPVASMTLNSNMPTKNQNMTLLP